MILDTKLSGEFYVLQIMACRSSEIAYSLLPRRCRSGRYFRVRLAVASWEALMSP